MARYLVMQGRVGRKGNIDDSAQLGAEFGALKRGKQDKVERGSLPGPRAHQVDAWRVPEACAPRFQVNELCPVRTPTRETCPLRPGECSCRRPPPEIRRPLTLTNLSKSRMPADREFPPDTMSHSRWHSTPDIPPTSDLRPSPFDLRPSPFDLRPIPYQAITNGGTTIFTSPPPPLFSLSSSAVTISFSNSTTSLPSSSLVVWEYWRKTLPVRGSRTQV